MRNAIGKFVRSGIVICGLTPLWAATGAHALEIRVIAGSSAANSSILVGPFTPFGSIEIPAADRAPACPVLLKYR